MEIKSSERLQELNSLSFMPTEFKPIGVGAFDIKIIGTKRDALCIWRTISQSGFETAPKIFEDVVTLRFPITGSATRRHIAQDYVVSPGYALLLPFEGMQSMRTAPEVDMISCTIGAARLFAFKQSLWGTDAIEGNFFHPLVTISHPSMQALQQAITRLHARMASLSVADDLYYPVIEEMIVFQLLSSWPRQSADGLKTTPAPSRVLRMALEYIEANLARPLTVSELAAVAGVSVRSLQLAFRRGLDQTPIQYIIDRRLERVHQQLLEKHAKVYVSQVAHQWGFYNIADFTRRYRIKYGETPSKTRFRRA
ncbi:AraC family transcriptional regulator [Rhizobium sp. RU35A]|uniref:helix-turn-helix transcriptional regulator n=1 Tax=Rhizobium sp. RU35A TaxID=1907414 RepID=UPI00165F5CF6|nr:AraC family transcriptional regulator [Rhizobium sp. RU35A]